MWNEARRRCHGGWSIVGLSALLVLCVASCRVPAGSIQDAFEHRAQALSRFPSEERTLSAIIEHEDTPSRRDEVLAGSELTLEAARAFAVVANPDIHAARARLDASLGRIDEARALFAPIVSLKHTSSRTFLTTPNQPRLTSAIQSVAQLQTGAEDPLAGIDPIFRPLLQPLFGARGLGANTSAFSDHTSALTVTWTLFDGFIREARLMAAKYQRDAMSASFTDVARLIVQAIDTAYYQAQLGHEQLRIARADETFSQEQFEETRKLRDAGRATQADVQNFRVRVLAAQANVAAAVGLRDTGRVVLAELMGLSGAELPAALALSPLATESVTEMLLPDVDDWVDRALESRPDLRRLAAISRREEENVRAAKGAFSPVVGVSGSWGFNRSSNIHYGEDDQSALGGLEIQWDLYTGGGRQARVRTAEAHRMEAVAMLQRTRLAVESQVRGVTIELGDAQQQIRLQRENVKIALETRRIVQAAYVAGRETLTRLNQTQRDYIDADVNLSLARIRLRQAWTDLRAAAAESSDESTILPDGDGG